MSKVVTRSRPPAVYRQRPLDVNQEQAFCFRYNFMKRATIMSYKTLLSGFVALLAPNHGDNTIAL